MSLYESRNLVSTPIGISFASVFTWAKRGGFSLLDQGLFAGANFLLSVLLARWLVPEEYGAFALAYSLLILLLAFHTAALTEPMLVFGPGKYADRFRGYLGLLLHGHVGVSALVALVLLAVALAFWMLGLASVAVALVGVAVASAGYLLIWLSRRAFYVRTLPHLAATGSGLYLGILLGGLYALQHLGALTVITSLLAVGFAGFFAGAWLLLLLRPRLWLAEDRPPLAEVMREHWCYGQWALATASLTWVPGNIYFALLPALVGLEGNAGLRAIVTLVMPMMHVSASLSVLLVPQLVRAMGDQGTAEARRHVRMIMIFVGVSGLTYALFLILFRQPIIHWLYGGQYDRFANLVFLVAIIPPLSPVVSVFGSFLRAQQRPDLIFRAYALSTLMTFTLGLGMTAILGVPGAGGGLVASLAVTAGTLVWFSHRAGERHA